MGKGRRPKSTHLRVITGNAGKRAVNRHEPQGDEPTLDELAPPEELGPVAKAWWVRHVGKLAGMQIVKSQDLTLCQLAAEAWQRYREAQEIVDDEGMIQVVEGRASKHPGINIAREWLVTYRHCCAELGLSPASRAKLSTGEEDDGIDDFLKGARPS